MIYVSIVNVWLNQVWMSPWTQWKRDTSNDQTLEWHGPVLKLSKFGSHIFEIHVISKHVCLKKKTKCVYELVLGCVRRRWGDSCEASLLIGVHVIESVLNHIVRNFTAHNLSFIFNMKGKAFSALHSSSVTHNHNPNQNDYFKKVFTC